MEEVWKSMNGVVENGEGYEVSTLGRVRSVDRYINERLYKGKILNLSDEKGGYLKVRFKKDGLGKNYRVHILVAKAFIPNLENKKEVNHIDGNKKNNELSNLEWISRSENMIHAYSTGLAKGHNGGTNKSVVKIDSETGEEIAVFNSLKDASLDIGVTSSSILKAVQKGRKCGGYLWSYHHEGHKHD